ncbi:MAG: tripartite tricarboxylate transporter TctB family protein [Clostridia bacterium]
MKDLIISLSSFSLGVFVYFYSSNFSAVGGGISNDPAYYPKILGIVMILLSVGLFISSFKNIRSAKVVLNKEIIKNMTTIIVVLVLYVQALVVLGFPISTALFTLFGIILFGGKLSTALKFFIPISGVIYLLFAILFKMPMPSGIFW